MNEIGGVVLGDCLTKAKINYSFWTGDSGHGFDGICAAYILGVISENDWRETIRSERRSLLNVDPKIKSWFGKSDSRSEKHTS